MVRTQICENLNETLDYASRFAEQLPGGSVVALYGGLGAGKTAFAQGVARGLGVTEPVTSPTYALWQTYGGGRLLLHHFDLYRLESPQQVFSIGFEDALTSDAVTLIEWPQRLEDALPSPRYEVYLERLDENRRSICITRVD